MSHGGEQEGLDVVGGALQRSTEEHHGLIGAAALEGDVAHGEQEAALSARAGASGRHRAIEITGQADSIASKQNAIKAITSKVGDAGLVNKIEVVQQKAPQPTPAAAAPGAQAAAGRTHKVAKGETLSHIAQKYYGKASEYNRIFEANKDQIKDPNKIRTFIRAARAGAAMLGPSRTARSA